MALGRQRDHQAEMLVSWVEMPRSPGHAFYDKFAKGVLIAAGFDRFVETQCAVDYAACALARPSLPPGRYFRMLLIGYFEGIDSERGLEWRCADSLSLREVPTRLGERERVPDLSVHSWLEPHPKPLAPRSARPGFSLGAQTVGRTTAWLKVERIGVDASTIEANAATSPQSFERDSGEGYPRDADAHGQGERHRDASGRQGPGAAGSGKRKGKKLSNADWEEPDRSGRPGSPS